MKAAEDTVGVEQSAIQLEIDERRKRHETTQITDIFQAKGLNNRQQADIFQRFVDTSSPEDLLYPDVEEYLLAVEESELVTAVLLTMGPRQHQEAKICAAGLQSRLGSVILDPAYVLNAEIKAPRIWDWRSTETGLFVPPINFGTIAPPPSERVVLADDKHIAFRTGAKRPERGNECGIGGFWVNREEEAIPLSDEERQALAEGVLYATGLHVVTGYVRDPQRFTLHPMSAVGRSKAA